MSELAEKERWFSCNGATRTFTFHKRELARNKSVCIFVHLIKWEIADYTALPSINYVIIINEHRSPASQKRSILGQR